MQYRTSHHVLANMHTELPNIASYYHHHHQQQQQQQFQQHLLDRYSACSRQSYPPRESPLEQLMTSSTSYVESLTTSNLVGSSSTPSSTSFQPVAVDRQRTVQHPLRHAAPETPAAAVAAELATGSRSSVSCGRFPAVDTLVNGAQSRYRACFTDTPRTDAPHCTKSEHHRRTDADNDVNDIKDVDKKSSVVSGTETSTATSASTQLQVTVIGKSNPDLILIVIESFVTI